MALFDVHIAVQAFIYFAIMIAGFVTVIPVGINRQNFQGTCILYGNIEWKNATSFVLHGSSSSNCNFPIYFGVFGLIFYGLATGLYNSYAVIKSRRDPDIGSQMWVMPFILVNTLLGFTTLIVGCMISVGFMQFCNGLTSKHEGSKCSMQENKTWQNINKGKPFNSGSYTKWMAVAQVAVWSCVLAFIVQVAFCILRFYRNRKKRSSDMFDSVQRKESGADTSRIAELEPTA
ncbi:hypothetical protein ACF0H5_003160 [Mactra antiquata]